MVEELIVFGCFFSLGLGLISWNPYILMIGGLLLFIIFLGIEKGD